MLSYGIEMQESAKRCFHSLADLVGKEVFIKLCMEYVEANLKRANEQRPLTETKWEVYYHPSINYEWNMGLDHVDG
jgi:hypothetical protein